MLFRTAEEAEDGFIKALRAAIGCVTKSPLSLGGDRTYGPDATRIVSFAKPAKLNSDPPVWLEISQQFQVLKDDDEGWRVRTLKYIYSLFVNRPNKDGEFLSFQWHPKDVSRVRWGHLHLKTAAKVGLKALAAAHIPTNRISVEDIVEMLISEFDVAPRERKWISILKSTKAEFEARLRWLIAHRDF